MQYKRKGEAMIKLLFIVPYPELEEKVVRVISQHPEKERINADIQVMTVEQTPNVPDDKYDAIIARGYTAEKTKHMYKHIPTIGLTISGYDIIQAIVECNEKFHPRKIAVCGFSGQMYQVESICKYFHIEAEVFNTTTYKDLPHVLMKAAASGCDALVGGYSAKIVADQMGIPSVIIKTGEDTILQATNEAVNTVDRIRDERIVSQMYKTIIYSSKDGILFVDSKGIIRVRNQVMRKMNGDISIMDKPLKEAMPYLYDIYTSILKSRHSEKDRILTIPNTKITVSIIGTPVIANGEVSGVIFSLSDITMIQELETQIRNKLNERGLKAEYTFNDIVHESKVIDRTIEIAKQYAASDSNVIIVGETGTGKELFAQSIHNSSKRKNGPFVAINCAALPENLLESELFGYVEGAFTGTGKGGKMGLFEQAHGGTLFLDEIGEISMSMQTKLLRVLQERQVRRIGDNKVININVRIISATNRSILRMVESGRFRRDLMYRLDVLRLFLPPLRKRENDVELLFKSFLNKYSPGTQLDTKAYSLLHEYPFHGNIRELRNIVERTIVLKSGKIITYYDLKNALYPPDLETSEEYDDRGSILSESLSFNEKETIERILNECNGNKTQASKKLGIDRSTLWRKMHKYKIE